MAFSSSTTNKVLSSVLTAVLVFIFACGGVVKLTNKFSAKAHQQMRNEFVRFATVHPAVLFGYQIDPEKFLKQIGVIEVAGATFLLFGARPLKLFSCLTLSSVMVGAMYVLYQLEEPTGKIAVPAVVLFMVFLRLHLFLIGAPRKKDAEKIEKTD